MSAAQIRLLDTNLGTEVPATPSPRCGPMDSVTHEAPADTVARIAAERGVALDAIYAPARRGRWLTDTRRAIAHALRARGMELREIAALVGCRNHTSVIYLLSTKRRTS